MSAAAPSQQPAAKPTNVYVHRRAATPRPCFVCHRPAPDVLTSQTLPTLDFFYVCLSHLGDRHFATRLSTPEAPQARLPDKVSQSEIDKIKAEYEARLKAKDDKAKEKEEKAGGSSSMTGVVFSTLTSAVSSVSQAAVATVKSSASPPPPAPPAAPAAPAADPYPIHSTYALHREFYAMRIREWNNKQFKKKEKELNMPRAPSGLI